MLSTQTSPTSKAGDPFFTVESKRLWINDFKEIKKSGHYSRGIIQEHQQTASQLLILLTCHRLQEVVCITCNSKNLLIFGILYGVFTENLEIWHLLSLIMHASNWTEKMSILYEVFLMDFDWCFWCGRHYPASEICWALFYWGFFFVGCCFVTG